LEAMGRGPTPAEAIAKLKQETQELKSQKKKVNAALRNAVRKNKRLKEKAKTLSVSDLVSLIAMKSGAAAPTPPGSDKKGGGASRSSAASSSGPAAGAGAEPDLDEEARGMD
jgi:hypothetical protein